MANLHRVLEEKNFGSIEEANDFLAKMSHVEDLVPQKLRSRRPLAEAQDLMYQAWDASSKKERVRLAKQALEISPDCADAYVLLAEEQSNSLSQAIDYYRQGMAAGERSLGKDFFNEEAGHFWGMLESRPYMRTRFGLASSLAVQGQKEEAVSHYWELLRLNQNDNQGVRYSLTSTLLELGKMEDLEKLFGMYPEDCAAQWLFARALFEFCRSGAGSAAANRALFEAQEQNPHVEKYLLGRKALPRQLPEYMGMGDEDEAIHCAAELGSVWRAKPGALEWLASATRRGNLARFGS